MKQRRRLRTAKSHPVTAIMLALALVASAVVGLSTSRVIQTQADKIDPVTPTLATDSFATGDDVVVDDAAIKSQGIFHTHSPAAPETERTVKQFTKEEEFSQFAITWTGQKDIAAFIRSQRPDGSWSEWFDTHPLEFSISDESSKQGTELIYVHPTKAIQVSLSGVDLSSPQQSEELEAVFINGGTSSTPENGITLASDSNGLPKVISRSGWGADESLRCGDPETSDSTKAIVIHHTAGSNDYSEEEAAGIIRGIYSYHAQTMGWCDIGYHALADKYGNLYEGRYGGLNKDIIGAHAGGFNENTWAISLVGNYQTEQPSTEMIESVGKLAGWRAQVAGIDPKGTDTHRSEGTEFTQFPAGTTVDLPNIFAHRDVGLTECPGDYAYAQLDTIRDIASKHYASLNGDSTATSTASKSAEATTTEHATSEPATPSTGEPQQIASRSQVNQQSANAKTALDLFQQLQNAAKKNASGVQDLITLAISIASAVGIIPGTTTKNGVVNTADGVQLTKLTAAVNEHPATDSDTAVTRHGSTLNPLIGQLRTPETHYTNGYGQEVSYALYDRGIVIDSPEVGTQALWGAIGDTWAAQGFDMGPLGLPLNQEYNDGKLKRVDFQGGYVTFNPATGATEVHTNQ
jgi:hypothetical protein